MEWYFKLYASVKNKILVISFVFFYHDTLILVMYTTHTTGEGFSSDRPSRCFSPGSKMRYRRPSTGGALVSVAKTN